MSALVVPGPAVVSVPVEGGGRFPVRRILCVGRNYGAHVREMGGDAAEQPPIFFTKPRDAVVTDGADVPYPTATDDLHHEVELVVALRAGGAGLSEAQALDCVFGYAVGVDLTRRDLQAAAKAAGQPWDSAKAFDASAPMGAILPAPGAPPPAGARLSLQVDGATRQDGALADMIWSVPQVLAAASRLWRLEAGDLVFTGTPEGVGPVLRGQHVAAGITGLPPLAFQVV